MVQVITPTHQVTYDGATLNVFHANKGEGLPRHEHVYAHLTVCQHRFQREQFLATLNEVSRGNYYLEFMLGCMYETGIGVAKNMNEAIRLFQKGSRRGDYSSMMKLMTLQLESGLK